MPEPDEKGPTHPSWLVQLAAPPAGVEASGRTARRYTGVAFTPPDWGVRWRDQRPGEVGARKVNRQAGDHGTVVAWPPGCGHEGVLPVGAEPA